MPSFEELFISMREQVWSLCLRLTGDRAEADDATQETFFEVYRGLSAFRAESQLSTWVFRIAMRAAIKARARRSRLAPLDSVADPAVQFDDYASQLDLGRVLQAMQRLSLDHRAVLALFAIDGLSHTEIAQVLAVPEGTVWSRLHAARRNLKLVLEGRAVSS